MSTPHPQGDAGAFTERVAFALSVLLSPDPRDAAARILWGRFKRLEDDKNKPMHFSDVAKQIALEAGDGLDAWPTWEEPARRACQIFDDWQQGQAKEVA